MNGRPQVRILLSTFNGERFFQQQLESLARQDYPTISIFIRDDGSTDGTLEIARAFASGHEGVTFYAGPNLGVTASFFDLLKQPAPDRTFFAFCDQDDVWLPHKISRAVDCLLRQPEPANTLYFSRLQYVDEGLRPLRLSRVPKFIDFDNSIVENVIAGCVMVFGQAVRARVLEAEPSAMLMHDWWTYLVATVFGEVVYDPAPTILYRQHGANVSQWERSWVQRIARRAREFAARWHSGKSGLRSLRQAEAFLTTYGDEIPEDKRKAVHRLVALRSRNGGKSAARFRYAIAPEVHRNRRLDDVVLRLIIALGQH